MEQTVTLLIAIFFKYKKCITPPNMAPDPDSEMVLKITKELRDLSFPLFRVPTVIPKALI